MLIDAITRAKQLREEIPHLIQPSQADYDRVCLLTEVETLRGEVSALRTRAESAEEAFKAAEGEHAELWAERNGWQARAESAERERDEAYAKGLLRAAGIVEEEGLDNCSCVDGEKCESCYTVDDILERLKAERP